MYAQVAIKPNPLLRNGAYGIVMRGVQKCTRGCSSLRGRNKLPLCCIKLDTATDTAYGYGRIYPQAATSSDRGFSKHAGRSQVCGYHSTCSRCGQSPDGRADVYRI